MHDFGAAAVEVRALRRFGKFGLEVNVSNMYAFFVDLSRTRKTVLRCSVCYRKSSPTMVSMV